MSTALQFSSRAAREKSFIVVWPGDDVVYLEFGGETICAPPIDVVAEAGKGRWRFGSAKDEFGRSIPGTVLITDRFSKTETGARKSFDAEFFLFGNGDEGRGLIGVNEPLVARGLMVVDDVSQVAEAQRTGRAMWEERQAKADDELIRQEFTRRQNHEARFPGIPVPVGSDDEAVRLAVERRKQRSQRAQPSVSTNDLVSALGGVAAVSAAPAKAPEPDPVPSLGDIATRLWSAAKRGGITLSKPHQAALLDQDQAGMEEVRAHLEEKGVAL